MKKAILFCAVLSIVGAGAFVPRAQAQEAIDSVFLSQIHVVLQTLKQSVSNLQAQVIELRQRIDTLQTQQTKTSGRESTAPEILAQPKFVFREQMFRGFEHSDVRLLQECLATLGFFKSTLRTNYYGHITEGAVREFQSFSGIVSSGDPATTGFGRVGPMTLEAINAECGTMLAQAQTSVGSVTQAQGAGNISPQPKISFWTMNTNSSSRFVYPPSFEDIDNDNDIDIVASSNSGIYAWEKNGTVLPGWPYLLTPPYDFYFAPSLADVNGDQRLEIFGGAENSRQFGFSHSGSLLPGWPQQLAGDSHFNHPSAVGDIENDGDIEIVGGTREFSSPAQIHVWNHDGSAVNGWPQNMQGQYARSIALADVDGDSDLEVIATDSLKVFMWHHNGMAYSPWPLAPQPDTQLLNCGPFGMGTYLNTPLGIAVGDVNNDGNPYIVIFTYNHALYEPCKRIWIHAYRADGAELPYFPIEISGLFAEFRPGITLADLDNDSFLEIIITTTKKFVVAKSDGTFQSFPQNFPAGFGQIFGAVAANIDNDPEIEIISPMSLDNTLGSPEDAWGEIHAWNHDGTIVAGFPISIRVIPTTMLSIADLDGDGRPEVAGGYEKGYDNFGSPLDTGIYVQKLRGALGTIEWGTYAHDVRNTNAHK